MSTSSQSNNLRAFHNNVKMSLLKSYAKNCNSLLDIGIGRGGDIFKIDRCNVKYLLGVDINPIYLEEALNRYTNSKIPNTRDYEFKRINDDEPNLSEYLKNYHNISCKFDIISCQFALHYYFKSKEKLQNLCKDLQRLLKPNGYFIGTVLDGKSVHSLLKQSGESEFMNSCIAINGKYDINNPLGYGDKIDFYMGGTLYFGESTVSHEYLVDIDILTNELKNHDIELIRWESFSKYYNHQSERHNKFNIPILNEDSKYASFLYNCFVFKRKAT